MKTIYTIGYAGFAGEDFGRALQANGVKVLVDVRSFPYSQYFAEYNKEHLQETLAALGIRYRHYATEFGARQEDRRFYPRGYLDFDLFIPSRAFQSGVEKLAKGMELGYTFALMCAEKDPLRCHRTIMVARGFRAAGYRVVHLLAPGYRPAWAPAAGEVTQEDVERALADCYFPERHQGNLFEEKAEEEYILDAYRLQNEKIGYQIDKAEDE